MLYEVITVVVKDPIAQYKQIGIGALFHHLMCGQLEIVIDLISNTAVLGVGLKLANDIRNRAVFLVKKTAIWNNIS